VTINKPPQTLTAQYTNHHHNKQPVEPPPG
jgi:hypothetical protein